VLRDTHGQVVPGTDTEYLVRTTFGWPDSECVATRVVDARACMLSTLCHGLDTPSSR
jgi:hypothetical protein